MEKENKYISLYISKEMLKQEEVIIELLKDNNLTTGDIIRKALGQLYVTLKNIKEN